MQRKILSIVLTLATLVGCFACFAPAAGAATEAPASSSKSSASYLDLYVKEGLVALFDAYSAAAADGDVTTWQPVDFYGKAGYDSYADPSSYTTSLVKGSNLGWKWENGYLSHYWHTDPGDRCRDDDSVFNIDEVGALLAGDYDYTVQAVYQYVLPYNTKQSSAPIIDGNVITNFSKLGAGTGSGCFLLLKAAPVKIGDFEITYLWYYPYLTNWNVNRIGVYYEQMPDNRNYLYTSEYYTGAKPADLVDENGNAIASPYVQMSPETGVFERSFLRTSATSITIHDYSPIPRWNGGGYGSNDLTLNVNNTASTKMHLLGDAAQRAYSVRVYSTVLTDAEINRNHLADLCGYYGIDVSEIVLMSEKDLAALANAVKDIKIARIASEKAGLKDALLDAIAQCKPAPDMSAEERQMTDYDKMYVGANGEKSENGAGLVALYTAYAADEKSINVDDGIWYNKRGEIDASLSGGTKSNDNTDGWTLRANGGFGYDVKINLGVTKYMAPQETSSKIVFNPDLISSPDFTVEYAAAYLDYILPDGTGYGSNPSDLASVPEDLRGTPCDRIGYLGNYSTRAGSIASNGGTIASPGSRLREVRWFVGAPSENLTAVYTRAGSYASGQNLWGDYSRSTTLPFVQGFTRDETESASGISATYSIFANAQRTTFATWSSANGANSFFHYPVSESGYVFELFNKAPVTVYAVRVYDGILTQSEMQQNRFADLAAYYGADTASYDALTSEEKRIVEGVLASFPFNSTKEKLEEEILSIASKFDFSFDVDSTLYVKDGLTVLLSGYQSLNTGSFRMNDHSLLWYNGVAEGTFATLEGTSWNLNPKGGYTLVKTLDDYEHPNQFTSLYKTKEDYAVILDGGMLPDASYTVEYVANPVGITNVDGTRYIDASSKVGIYHENATAIGPLRAMQFNAMRSGESYFERRWVYGVGDQPYSDAIVAGTAKGGKGDLPGYTYDHVWSNLGLEQVITTTITLDTSSDHVYRFYSDGEETGSSTIKLNAVISNQKANNMFRLMGGFAGTIYSVRVYDRVLSEKERIQNHFADLVYYYDIDLSAIQGAISAMGDIYAVAAPFAELGFDMEKTEAQEYFNSRMAVIWLSYQNYGIRADKTDGIRYYFDLSWTGINAMLSADVSIEIGAVVNVGKSADPVLEGYGYDYRITAFDSVAGKYNGFFVDDDTFAVTVRYTNSDRETLLTNVRVQGYVKLTLADGTSAIYYLNTTDATPDNHFEAYNSAAKNAGSAVSSNVELYNHALARIESCYSDVYVYLDAAAAEGGDGSKNAPHKYFEDAFASIKAIMQSMNAPSHVNLVAKDGVYSVSKEQKLTAAECVYPHYDLTFTSESGKPVLSSLVDMTGEFTSAGGNLWTYQFEKDANGEYPSFRYLYVDGKFAEFAHNGGTTAFEGDRIYTAFDRDFEGVYATAKDLGAQGKLTLSTMPENYAGRSDLSEIFIYYRSQFVAYYEAEAIYNSLSKTATSFSSASGALANAKASKGTDTAYLSAFNTYKTMFLARYEAECLARLYGSRTAAYASCTASKTDATYVSTFNSAKAHIRHQAINVYWDDVVMPYEITVARSKGDGKSFDKYYVSDSVLGDLSSYMEEGKALMLAYADTLESETHTAYDAAVAAAAAAALKSADATLVYNTLLTLKDVAADAFLSTLDAKIAAAKAASDSAAEADKHNAAVVLGAYEALKTAIGTDDARTAYDAYLSARFSDMAAAQKDSAAADGVKKDATNAKTNADLLIAELRDERLWKKHAMTPFNVEINFLVQYTMNEHKLLGIDYDDVYVRKNADGTTETFYACYLERYQWMRQPVGGSGNYPIDGYCIYATGSDLYVDSEGEYYYDKRTGTLYYYGDVEGKSFARPQVDNILTFEGVDNLAISGFTFTGVDDYYRSEHSIQGHLGMGDLQIGHYQAGGFPDRAAIHLENVTGLKVTKCDFHDLGCDGISATGWVEDVVISECNFENIGAAGVRLGQNVRVGYANEWLYNEGVAGQKDIEITENYFHNISTYYLTAALQVTSCTNGLIKNNTIRDTTYIGISAGWDWSYVDAPLEHNLRNVEISYNFVAGFMTDSHDGGAIYVCGPNANVNNIETFNSVHHNFVLWTANSSDGTGAFSAGLYFDGGSSNYDVYENVIVTPAYGAADGETNYEKYGITAERAAYIKANRKGAVPIYLQHIAGQPVHNIELKNNYIVNVRAQTKDEKVVEAYRTYLAAAANRNVVEKDTVYVVDVGAVPRAAIRIVEETGSRYHMGAPDEFADNVY